MFGACLPARSTSRFSPRSATSADRNKRSGARAGSGGGEDPPKGCGFLPSCVYCTVLYRYDTIQYDTVRGNKKAPSRALRLGACVCTLHGGGQRHPCLYRKVGLAFGASGLSLGHKRFPYSTKLVFRDSQPFCRLLCSSQQLSQGGQTCRLRRFHIGLSTLNGIQLLL